MGMTAGLGRHSKGGPSLPAAIRTFLLSQGYGVFSLNQTHLAVVCIKQGFKCSSTGRL